MSFKWKGAVISAREMTIRDEDILLRVMQKKPLPDNALVNSANPFVQYALFSEVQGEPPIPRPGEHDSAETWAAAYEQWLDMPTRFKKQWMKEIEEQDNLPNP